MSQGQRWDIFCAVVDNFGDIGVCWRLARQLANEYGFRVRLWVDDLVSLQKICPEADPLLPRQFARRVEVCAWSAPFRFDQPAEVVIEAFGCALPVTYVEAMAAPAHKPAWVNLEYLSAEEWVEGCHGLPSPHPHLPLTKYFFFPGFTSATGGLLLESDLHVRRHAFQGDPCRRESFWCALGLPPPATGESRVSLFGYENAALPGLLDAWSGGEAEVVCLVPEGRLVAGLAAHFGRASLAVGESVRRGNLLTHVLPFMEQERYDELLWACDLNFVRGEDSFVRAQWAARPLVWQIYPQEDDVHRVKLRAFLDRYCAALSDQVEDALRDLWEAWNQGSGADMAWEAFWQQRAALDRHAGRWACELMERGELAAKLVQFCRDKI